MIIASRLGPKDGAIWSLGVMAEAPSAKLCVSDLPTRPSDFHGTRGEGIATLM